MFCLHASFTYGFRSKSILQTIERVFWLDTFIQSLSYSGNCMGVSCMVLFDFLKSSRYEDERLLYW